MAMLACAGMLAAAGPQIVAEVRAAIARQDLPAAERLVESYRKANGSTPQTAAALSWLGRGALAAQQFDRAERYAGEARQMALELLRNRALDAEPNLGIALGASIEVQAQALAARSRRAEAVAFLQEELKRWQNTSIRTRIQKNVHLLSLEGKPAPGIDTSRWIGAKPGNLNGHPVLIVFWAHWCPDCKRMVPELARIMERFGPRGLRLVGPTQLYGYTARGQEAAPAEEMRYIEEVRKTYYAPLGSMLVPVSAGNFEVYGASTTPTVVLVDRLGIVRLYHPGNMSYAELAPRIEAIVGG